MASTHERCLILIRGLPGSGKTTFANSISEGGKYPVLSVDDYFTNPITNEYRFRFEENHLAYKNCLEKTREAMNALSEKVIIHNTFVFDWEIQPYFELAQELNYMVFMLTMEKSHDRANVHGITEEQIGKMAERYRVKLY